MKKGAQVLSRNIIATLKFCIQSKGGNTGNQHHKREVWGDQKNRVKIKKEGATNGPFHGSVRNLQRKNKKRKKGSNKDSQTCKRGAPKQEKWVVQFNEGRPQEGDRPREDCGGGEEVIVGEG